MLRLAPSSSTWHFRRYLLGAVRPGSPGAYALAFLSSAAALGIVLGIGPSDGDDSVAGLAFLAAVALSGWYGDLGPALVAAALGALAIDYFVETPRYTLEVTSQSTWTDLLSFLLVALVVRSLNARLRAERDRTEAALESRDDLVDTVSHELRTPLTTIKTSLYSLRHRAQQLSSVNRDGLLLTIETQTDRLTHVVTEALALQRLENGVTPHAEWMAPGEVASAVLDRCGPALGTRPVHFAVTDDLPLVRIDPGLLDQALTVLLEVGPNVQVVNGGVPGYVALREVAFVCSDVLDLQPDVVVDLDGLNDIYYGTLEEWPAQIAADQLGMLADGRCPEIPAMIDSTTFPHGLLEYHAQMLYRDARLALFHQLHAAPPPAPRMVSERIIALHAGSLGLLARYGRERGSAVIAALQPLVAVGNKLLSPNEVDSIEHEGYWDVGGWAELAKVMYSRLWATTGPAVEAEGGTFVNLSGAFDTESGTTYAEDAVHYTALGQRRLAEALAPLVKHRLLRASRG